MRLEGEVTASKHLPERLLQLHGEAWRREGVRQPAVLRPERIEQPPRESEVWDAQDADRCAFIM